MATTAFFARFVRRLRPSRFSSAPTGCCCRLSKCPRLTPKPRPRRWKTRRSIAIAWPSSPPSQRAYPRRYVATESARVSKAIAALHGRGISVVTLVGDAAPEIRAAYVGIDNVMAGRTAGRLLRMAHTRRPGLVLPIVGTLSARDHRERVEGLQAVLDEAGHDVTSLPAIAVQDRSDLMRARLAEALAAHPQITAIYSI